MKASTVFSFSEDEEAHYFALQDLEEFYSIREADIDQMVKSLNYKMHIQLDLYYDRIDIRIERPQKVWRQSG